MKSLERIENLLSIKLGLARAEARDFTDFGKRRRMLPAEIIERGIVHYDKRRDVLAPRRGSPPFTKIGSEFGEFRSFILCLWNEVRNTLLLLGMFIRLASLRGLFLRGRQKPIRIVATDIACTA